MQLRSQSCDSVNESPFCRGFRSQSRDFSVLATHADTACVHALLKSLSGLHAQALRKALLGCQAVAAFHVSLNPKTSRAYLSEQRLQEFSLYLQLEKSRKTNKS